MALLLAVDLNDPNDELLAQAGTWAERLSTTVDLVFVDTYPYTVLDPGVQRLLAPEWKRAHQAREARLRTMLDGLPAAVRGTVSIRHGRAAQEIVEAGRDHQGILLATHGHQGLPHVLLGSVAERVIRLATVPVLVFPPRGANSHSGR